MKVYIVEIMRHNNFGDILNCLILKCYKNRDSANNYILDEDRRYASLGFDVSILNDGVYIDRVKAERKNY